MTEPRAATMRCGAARRGARARRRRLRRLALGIVGLAAAALGASIAWPPRPRFVWNASASVPVGLYHVGAAGRLKTGDMVIAHISESYRLFAARRRYLPANVPLVKRVAAESGDTVCAIGEGVFVNARPVATRLVHDSAGRPMPWWTGCIVLRRGALFLLMADSPASFDGRYFGQTGPGDIVGKATLLWRR